jgi:hypothetical protein
MTVRIFNLEPHEYMPLMPAPSVHDGEIISSYLETEQISDRGLEDGPLRILTHYRGSMLYLDNGALVYRWMPKTAGGNGLVSIPETPTIENCFILHEDKMYTADVEVSSLNLH